MNAEIKTAENGLVPGDHFMYKDVEFVVLDISEERGELFAVTANIVETMQFSSECSDDWKKSDIRHYLNTDFLDRIGEEDLIEQTSDLTALDGDTVYGTCKDMVAILSLDQYRKFRYSLPKYNSRIWLLTSWSPYTGSAYYPLYVDPSGTVNTNYATNSYGVAPACLFNLNNLKSRRQARN